MSTWPLLLVPFNFLPDGNFVHHEGTNQLLSSLGTHFQGPERFLSEPWRTVDYLKPVFHSARMGEAGIESVSHVSIGMWAVEMEGEGETAQFWGVLLGKRPASYLSLSPLQEVFHTSSRSLKDGCTLVTTSFFFRRRFCCCRPLIFFRMEEMVCWAASSLRFRDLSGERKPATTLGTSGGLIQERGLRRLRHRLHFNLRRDAAGTLAWEDRGDDVVP
ncbi:hypothetical protein CAPTEDRAFT_196532 [Capitella teleta]|uniref:Uncharacterized protein n=1 Tax=Capitella teleta TaxID=283909 RepID=R7U4M3_CAPTE|nr:hypothetical protein CAPTEDRAFT_196532 [Capitella teleta]|eukprot:ELT98641.1 hypothetical protein CAPTEDRAFT_196532 [Capitella teleta]